MPISIESLCNLASNIINNISKPSSKSVLFRISKTTKMLKKLLKIGNTAQRKIASLCILYLSHSSKEFYKHLRNEKLIKYSKNYVIIGLNEINLVKKTRTLKNSMRQFKNYSCSFNDKFYFKFGSSKTGKSEILSLTEIKFHLEKQDLSSLPDPKEHTLWTAVEFSESSTSIRSASLKPKRKLTVKKEKECSNVLDRNSKLQLRLKDQQCLKVTTKRYFSFRIKRKQTGLIFKGRRQTNDRFHIRRTVKKSKKSGNCCKKLGNKAQILKMFENLDQKSNHILNANDRMRSNQRIKNNFFIQLSNKN